MKQTREEMYKEIVEPMLSLIIDYKREGYTDEQIAGLLGISYQTLKRLNKEHSALSSALKEGKKKLIADLADTLYRKALGKITTKDTKKFIEEGANGQKKVKIEETVKEYAPDTGALCFALCNLAPDRFKNIRTDTAFSDLEEKLKDIKSFSERAAEIKQEEINNVSEESAI